MQLHLALQQYSSIAHSTARTQAPTKMVQLPGADATKEKNQEDKVSISPEGKEKSAAASVNETSSSSVSAENENLSKEELAALTKLQARDKEVRAHEQAHLAAAGGYATSGASFTFQKGPDGNSYAVGGEVGIDMSKESDPSATIQKMRAVKRAALAPASPSSVDRQVAAQATVKETMARKELIEEQEKMLESSATSETEANAEISPQEPATDSGNSPSISSLKAITAYEQISAL